MSRLPKALNGSILMKQNVQSQKAFQKYSRTARCASPNSTVAPATPPLELALAKPTDHDAMPSGTASSQSMVCSGVTVH